MLLLGYLRFVRCVFKPCKVLLFSKLSKCCFCEGTPEERGLVNWRKKEVASDQDDSSLYDFPSKFTDFMIMWKLMMSQF